ncbi:cilia- and flagella-associated protein 36 isoform X2 [Hemiscyllium ocellatum]|uniref:cilia- and flagella-associated protein 36 isoform X2 n=1 Tax=Hemiscyllium ocellatum TaxID=170820 RepID=UPI0029668C2D|nr:cilia- and flagella-associated protein 36 isoform X2 [Hemiscyllium ocellatum]
MRLFGCHGNRLGTVCIRGHGRPAAQLSRFPFGFGKMEEWMVEGIAGFLSSSCWTIPITDFIEQNCAVFDDEEENKLSYTEIHQDYKDLVEQLLESYLQDVGIQEDQFLEACNSPLAQSESFQPVFQPVLAAEDFQVFKSLMLQKNIELQLQALRMIQERNGVLPECLTDGEDKISELEQQELRILREVLRQSKDEYEREVAKRYATEAGAKAGSTQSDLEKAIVENAQQEEARLSRQHEQGKENLQRAVQKSLQKRTSAKEDAVASTSNLDENVMKSKNVSEKVTEALPSCEMGNKMGNDQEKTLSEQSNGVSRKALGPVRVPVKGEEQRLPLESVGKRIHQSDAAETWLQQAKKEAGISGSVMELSESDRRKLQERAAYLKEQRDKLVAMKKEQREKHLPKNPESQKPQPILETKEISEEEKQKIQKRKHLAEKLKQEVIKK